MPNGYRITDAVSQAFRQFLHANHNKIEDPIFYCDTIEHGKMFYKAFTTLLHTQFKNPTFNGWNDQATYISPEDNFDRSVKIKIKLFDKRYNYCYSIAKKENTHKGISKLPYERLLNILNKDGYDLGDSRNFNSAEELIDKLLALNSSEIYVGTNCSWLYLAEIFNVPAIHTDEWIYR